VASGVRWRLARATSAGPPDGYGGAVGMEPTFAVAAGAVAAAAVAAVEAAAAVGVPLPPVGPD
jgi:hypothetical protein